MSEKTILVIDDDRTISTLVCAVLEDRGHSVISALNGKDGLEKAINELPDAIILDKQMPEMSGDEVLEQLQDNSETKNIPVIMLTGESQITEVSQSLERGALDYIVKPFDNDNLIVRLDNILNKNQ